MASTLFAESLKSHLDIPSINRYFVGERDKTVEILQTVRPEGRVEGSRFKLASESGGAGNSWDFNLENGKFGDWAGGSQSYGVVDFLCRTLRCSPAQAVKWLTDKKFLNHKEAKKALADADGNPLVLPIPLEQAKWEAALEADDLRKDRGIIKDHWEIKDTDGALLGFKYRVDERRSHKEVFTLTYRAETGWTKRAWDKKRIPPYGLEKIKSGPTLRVLFVEGEKACDAAQDILGDKWKVLSFSGVAAAEELWLPDDEFWNDCDVVIWPDNDSPGKAAARKIQLALQALNNPPREIKIVRVDAIPALPPKWDLGDWYDGCGVDVPVELERAEVADSFEAICRQWVYVGQTNLFYNLEDRGLIYTTTSFDNQYARYADRSGSASKKFLMSLETTRLDDLEFIPGEERILTAATGKRFLNEWYPSNEWLKAKAIAEDESIPMETIEENAKEFITHVRRVCEGNLVEAEIDPATGKIKPETENRELSDALFLYLATLVRRPMDKQGWVPMLLSENNGTGKTYFIEAVGSILGANRTTTVTVKQYIGQYHDWRDGVLFYELGEAKHEENTEAYEELKKNHNFKPFNFAKVEDRQHSTLKLNIKSRGMKIQRDFLNGYITSNNLFPLALSSSATAEASDRRLMVIRCERILTTAEADAMFAEIAQRPEWIGAYLMRYQPRYLWNPGWAPVTEHKRLIMEQDKERAERRADRFELGKYDEFFYLMQWARDEKLGGFVRGVVSGDLCREIANQHRVKYPHETARFDKLLDRAGLQGPRRIKDQEGNPVKVYALDPEFLEKPDEEWRREYLRSLSDYRL
jgi:hypothetical protein